MVVYNHATVGRSEDVVRRPCAGHAAAKGTLIKEIKWRQNCNYLGYRFVAIAVESGGLLSDTTLGLLEELANRLPANDRPRFATFC